MLKDYLDHLPLIAILRGLKPDEAIAIGHALVDKGFSIIEVPLNSPSPLESIARLTKEFGDKILIGAGTVLSPTAVGEVKDAGGRIIVMPNSDAAVICKAKSLGLFCAPGVMTPTEGFAALANGADALKLFPADILPPQYVKAVRAIYPRETLLLPVGGITPDTMTAFHQAGANGFGLGSALYKPGQSAEVTAQRAEAFVTVWKALVTETTKPDMRAGVVHPIEA